jgi:glutamine synthetase
VDAIEDILDHMRAFGVDIITSNCESKIVGLLGDEFVRAYGVMRRYELQRFADHVTDWEIEEYLEVY